MIRNHNFWDQLKQGFVGLAPMDGVTDQPMRHITAKYGSPDVIFTEFTHVSGLCHGASVMLRQLLYDQSQRPIVAQIYGKEPEHFRQVALLVAALGFDGVDINMGCPSKSVAGGGAGAALISNPQLAQKIITAVKQGVGDWMQGKTCQDCPDFTQEICDFVTVWQGQLSAKTHKKLAQHLPIPVSVKTRLGVKKPQVEPWISTLAAVQPAVISLHGRTLKQSYRGQANWQLIGQAAQIAHQHNIKLLGNGDVENRLEAEQKCKQYGVDGVLIGRAAQGNPLVFNTKSKLDSEQRIEIALEHAQYYQQYFQACQEKFAWQKQFSFLPMRKHLAWYIKGMRDAAWLRSKLVRTNSAQEVEAILMPLLQSIKTDETESKTQSV